MDRISRTLAVLWETLFTWRARVNQRRRLAALEDHQLKDMGISRADAEREAGKPFWRP